jgi:hypothetical protein
MKGLKQMQFRVVEAWIWDVKQHYSVGAADTDVFCWKIICLSTAPISSCLASGITLRAE